MVLEVISERHKYRSNATGNIPHRLILQQLSFITFHNLCCRVTRRIEVVAKGQAKERSAWDGAKLRASLHDSLREEALEFAEVPLEPCIARCHPLLHLAVQWLLGRIRH